MTMHRVQGKSIVLGLFVVVVGLLEFGCKLRTAPIFPEDTLRRRESPTNDTSFAEMSWREFRPFRVFVPSDIEVQCCCADEVRMVMTVPGMKLPVVACVEEPNSNDIDLAILVHRLSCNNPADWYMEKRFSDRRLLMDFWVSTSSESTVSCVCELNTGECLRFYAHLEHGEDTDYVNEWLWRLCRNLKFEITCHDAFTCLKEDVPIKLNAPATEKRKWDRTGPELGAFEWRSFPWFDLYVPSALDIENCVMDVNHFYFDLPGNRHYVTIDFCGESDRIDEQAAFCAYSGELLKRNLHLYEKKRVQSALVLKQRIGLDWYMDEEFSDRRLLVMHRHQSEGCEGVSCYCEYKDGNCVEFCIRGSGPISKDEIDYFLQICQSVRVREIVGL